MKLREGITEALDRCSVPYELDSWAPLKPPQSGPYAVVVDEVETNGDDSLDRYYFIHDTRIELYDEGFAQGKKLRDDLMLALADLGVPCTRLRPIYIQSEKRYQTVYQVDEYLMKESEA